MPKKARIIFGEYSALFVNRGRSTLPKITRSEHRRQNNLTLMLKTWIIKDLPLSMTQWQTNAMSRKSCTWHHGDRLQDLLLSCFLGLFSFLPDFLVASCRPRRKLVVLIPFYFFVVSWKISNLQNTSLLRWYHKSAIWYWNTSERILCYRSDSVSKFSVHLQCFKASITWRYFKKIQD